MYEHKMRVAASHTGEDGYATVFSLSTMLQDCSQLWLESEPATDAFLRDNNVIMLITSRQMDIYRKPAYGERVSVVTSIWKVKGYTGYRNTFIYDESGDACVASWALGAFVDGTTGRLIKVPDEVFDTVKIDPRKDMEYLGRKIELPDMEPELCGAITAQRSDIDFNQHVNNTRYIRMAFDLLDGERADPRRMRVEYKAQARQGDQLIRKVYDGDDLVVVSLDTPQDEPCAVVEFSRFV